MFPVFELFVFGHKQRRPSRRSEEEGNEHGASRASNSNCRRGRAHEQLSSLHLQRILDNDNTAIVLELKHCVFGWKMRVHFAATQHRRFEKLIRHLKPFSGKALERAGRKKLKSCWGAQFGGWASSASNYKTFFKLFIRFRDHPHMKSDKVRRFGLPSLGNRPVSPTSVDMIYWSIPLETPPQPIFERGSHGREMRWLRTRSPKLPFGWTEKSFSKSRVPSRSGSLGGHTKMTSSKYKLFWPCPHANYH